MSSDSYEKIRKTRVKPASVKQEDNFVPVYAGMSEANGGLGNE